MKAEPPVIYPLGDAALVLAFGDTIDPLVNARVTACAEWLRAACWPGIASVIPAYATLTVCYDPCVWLAQELRERLAAAPCGPVLPVAARPLIEIPVCYDAAFAPDLEAVSAHSGLSVDEVVRRHHDAEYRVHFIGFVPGFPYLGGLDPLLRMPRRATPRAVVPAGSVAIGEAQTGVYPLATPGGWHIVGRTPARLFDAARDPPCLLRAGDRLRFVPVSPAEYRLVEADASRWRR